MTRLRTDASYNESFGAKRGDRLGTVEGQDIRQGQISTMTAGILDYLESGCGVVRV